MAKYDVTASIVTYNNEIDLLNRAISSFLNTTLNVRIYISDNSESPELKDKLIKDERIEYIFNNANNGFGEGHNVVIDKIIDLSQFHIILNPDIEYDDKNLLEKLVHFAALDSNTGAIMPKVIYPNGDTQLLAKLLPSPGDLFGRRFLPFLANKNFDLKFSGYNRTMEVPFITGCFMFIKTSVLKDVGGFDRNYFMYCEDIDLSRRIHRKYKTFFFPEVTVKHHYAKASYKNKKLLKVHIQSAITYFNKWGWIFDKERKDINEKALQQFKTNDKN